MAPMPGFGRQGGLRSTRLNNNASFTAMGRTFTGMSISKVNAVFLQTSRAFWNQRTNANHPLNKSPTIHLQSIRPWFGRDHVFRCNSYFLSCGLGLYSQIRTLLQRRSLQRSFSPSLRFRFCPFESNLGTSSSANWWLV